SGQEPGENGSGDGFGAVVRSTAGKLRVIRKMKNGVNCFEMWWPGTELNRRRQPFQGCSHPDLSSCNPYLYRRLHPHFDRSYWTHNGPNNQTHADSGVRPDSDRANGSLVVKRL